MSTRTIITCDICGNSATKQNCTFRIVASNTLVGGEDGDMCEDCINEATVAISNWKDLRIREAARGRDATRPSRIPER